MVTSLKTQVNSISSVTVQFHILVRVLSRVLSDLILCVFLLSLAASFYCSFVSFVGDSDYMM